MAQVSLDEYVAIYLPSKDASGQPLPERDALLEWLLVEMALAFGGATATQTAEGQGAWTTPTGVVVVEPITIVKSFCAPGVDHGRLRALARELKARAQQETVAIETSAGMELV